MKNRKKLFGIIGGIAFLIVLSIILFFIFSDKNKLNRDEKKWITNNKDNLVDIRVINDINTFGIDGSGVFFDFINDFTEKYGITFNSETFSLGAYTSGLTFNVGNTVTTDDLVFYTDHYVLVGKNAKVINDITALSSVKIGVLNSELTYISYYLTKSNATFTQFDSREKLIASLEDMDYIVVPLNMYLDTILKNNYYINYHFSDINQYYYLTNVNNEVLNSIIRKFYNNWINSTFEDSYFNNLYNTFIKSLNITDVQLHELTSKEYTYASLNVRPYELLHSGKFGGITNVYISKFKKMTGIDFSVIKYKSINNLKKAIQKGKIDLYFGNYKLDNEFKNIDTLLSVKYDVIAKNSNPIIVNSLNSLKGKNVYVLESSPLYEYFTSLNIVTVKTYKKINEIQGIIDEDNIVVIDSSVYSLYKNVKIKNTTSRYTSVTGGNYSFMSNCDDVFNKLFARFVGIIDPNEAVVLGFDDYYRALTEGNILDGLVSYSLNIVLGGSVVSYILYKYSKRKKLKNKIKKEDRMKYIDMLTSLKNRNYLNENIESWDENTIYPQAVIIVDLNNIKYINDTYGHGEGDKQIKACANILIKTQLDNTELIRTDGNEFLIYLVGYDEKKIANYIRKLSREFTKLPYNYGAALGYSVISDDLKLIDDAINEATLDMRTNKDKGE